MRVLRVLVAAALLAMPFAVTGCGGEGGDAKVANVTSGDLPSGAEWTGVYYSEQYGFLHIVAEGSTVQGKWIRPTKDKWGELKGTTTGDVIKFSWIEHTVGVVGPAASRNGKGYFKYKRPAGDNVDDSIVGEIGRNNNEVGDAWDAIKQRNVVPDLKSIGGTGTTDIGGGDWDKENKEHSAPEAPKPPSL